MKELLDKEIHPTIIALGYRQSAQKAQEILESISLDSSDKDTLTKVAMTAMTGKGTEKARAEARKTMERVKAAMKLDY